MSTWNHWITAVREGDEEATRDFWVRYAQPLIRLADRNLSQRLRRRVDPEDVVQSTFRTVLRRIQGGEFRLEGEEDIWRLLTAIALNKSRQQARFFAAKKRDAERDLALQVDDQAVGRDLEATPEDAVVLVDLVDHVIRTTTDDEERRVLLLKLDDCSNFQIAQQMQCSERTVQRIVARLRQRFATLLDAE